METVLSVKEISKKFAQKTVVNQISFEVRKGEILGVLGPNGAGKTTVIRSIMDIIKPDSGEIQFNFEDNENYLPKIGYLPEERGLYKDITVMNMLLYLASLKEYPKEKARKGISEYLEKFNLIGKEKVKIKELSKGMAQKVQFIGAILHKPAILILDEPFSGLDPVSQDVFGEEVRNLAKEGAAILLSSHQMNLVEHMCDNIFMIHKGEKVIHDTLLNVKREFGSFKCEISSEEDVKDILKNLEGVEKLVQNGVSTTLYLEKTVDPIQFLKKLPDNLKVEEVAVKRDSLHNIFIKTVESK